MSRSRSFRLRILIPLLLLAPAAGSRAADVDVPTDPCLGQSPPGQVAELFAPGVVPVGNGDASERPAGLAFGDHVFVAPDASFVLLDGHGADSLGQSDVYAAFADPSAASGWTAPVNLGPRVNSAGDESRPSLSPDGRYLFFSRAEKEGGRARVYWVDAAVVATARRIAAEGESARIERIVRDAIAWALTKDRALFESLIVHDDDYVSFRPRGLEPVRGWDQVQQGFDLWLDDRFVATGTDVRDFHCRFSRGGDVAWYSAILDDCYTWDGEPGCWADTRWTGVLEKLDGRWQIMQMHFSFAADKVAEETRAELTAEE